MKAEGRYLDALQMAARWRIQDGKLYLTNSDGRDIVVFRRED
jgi:hypothetical protein